MPRNKNSNEIKSKICFIRSHKIKYYFEIQKQNKILTEISKKIKIRTRGGLFLQTFCPTPVCQNKVLRTHYFNMMFLEESC